jgi:hypothetical protein
VPTLPCSPNPRRWRIRLVAVLVAAVALPFGAAVLYRYPPGEGTFYPTCVFHSVTGLHCPGCGATRCLHALVHGDLPQALAYNPLLVVALPLLAVGFVQTGYRQWTGRRLPLPRMPAWSIRVIFWVTLAFWILRNIPISPMTLLAQHAL